MTLGAWNLAPILLLAGACQSGSSGPAITGDDLGTKVAQLENESGYTFHCEDVQTFHAGAISDCHVGDEGGISGTYRVTFDDDQGHFHVDFSPAACVQTGC